jgi:hypothetical protein
VQDYPVRATHRRNLGAEALAAIARNCFGTAEVDGNAAVVMYGAIARLSASGNGKELRIDVQMNPKVPEETARETIARYNRFLEEVTGFSSKERAKRLRKSASGSSSGG